MDSDLLGAGLMAPRQLRNCMPCKKRKIKCDRMIPCGPCSLRRDGKNCTPAVANLDDAGEQTEPYVSVSDFKALAHHVQVLRDKVKALESAVGRGGAVDAPAPAPLPEELSPVTSRRHMGDDEMVFALEDFQMSHRINTMRNRHSPDFGAPAAAAGDEESNHIGESHPLAFVIPPGTDYLAQAIALLPDQQISARLVQEYFDKVEWFQRCLHYPTFMSQCRQFWDSNGASNPSPDFVATYMMVLCLGLSTSSESFGANGMELAEQLYHLAEGVIMCSRYLHRQTFESLQAISLMTIYGYGMEDGADATWALCGSAIKIAQNLGLNRLEAEQPGKVWTALWDTRLKREIGRRVWWCFVSLDWAHAIAHGSTYSVHPSQNLTALPSNLDDEQLEDPTAVPRPLSVYTPISMHIFRCKFVTLYREITDHMTVHKTPSYAFILAMDDSIIDLSRSLPPHFQDPMHLPIDADPALVTDSIFLSITANTRLVRLHRYFFIRGYGDERYKRSKERCVEAAQTVLRLLDLATERTPSLLNFWIVQFYAFSAAVPVCIDLMFEPTEEKRQMVRRIIETLRDRSSTRPAARNSVFVLERLLEKENEFSAAEPERPAKRRRGSDPDAGSSPRQAHLKKIVKNILKTAPFGPSDSPPASVPTPAQSSQFSTEAIELPSAATADISDLLALDTWPGLQIDWFDSLWTQTDTTWPEMMDRSVG